MDMMPHQWVARARRDEMKAIQDSDGIWLCMGCYCCAARCPRGLRPIDIAEEARAAVVHKKEEQAILLDRFVQNAGKSLPQQLLVAALRKKR
jgi:heterodisulfide reductase subunit C